MGREEEEGRARAEGEKRGHFGVNFFLILGGEVCWREQWIQRILVLWRG